MLKKVQKEMDKKYDLALQETPTSSVMDLNDWSETDPKDKKEHKKLLRKLNKLQYNYYMCTTKK